VTNFFRRNTFERSDNPWNPWETSKDYFYDFQPGKNNAFAIDQTALATAFATAATAFSNDQVNNP